MQLIVYNHGFRKRMSCWFIKNTSYVERSRRMSRKILKEANRRLTLRLAYLLQDADKCDATFVV